MTTSLSAAELAHLITAVPGVRAIEPGIGSTLRALGSHMRQQDPQQARFGVIVEEGSRRAVIEIGIDGSRPVKDIVRDVQETIIRSPVPGGRVGRPLRGPGGLRLLAREQSAPQVTVRVQSLL